MSLSILFKPSPSYICKPMTTGKDPEAGESTGVTKMPSVTPIQHMPYLDHNYGQPPPMTPPDSNSPPEDCDTGNEDDEDDGVTRCICDFNHDDGYMICCDKCSVWQHIECMGIKSDAVPENYLCDQCHPRALDVDRAKAIQARKKEELSDDDDEDDESDVEPRDVTSYTAVSNTPTRITLTARVSRPKRSRAVRKGKVENHEERKQKRRRRPKPKACPEFGPSVDEDAVNEPWILNYSSYDNYEVIKENVYSTEVLQLDLSLEQNVRVSLTGDAEEQLCKVVEVQRHSKGIVAAEDMNKDQFVIQVKGKITSQLLFEEENPFFKRSSLYVLYYSKLDRMQLCIDARTRGNDARFVRRSCSPNAEVRHFVYNGNVCFGIFSTTPLPKGAEVTIPFEFSYSDYHCPLPCACAQDTCAVAKYTTGTMPGSEKKPRIKSMGEDSNSGLNKLSPLRECSTGNHSAQGDSDSDIENNPDKSMDASNGHKKLSREERKLEAYLKQIEKMEKKEKKKQQTGTPKESRYPGMKVVHESECTTEAKQTPKPVMKNSRKSMKRGMGFCPQGMRRKRVRVTSGSSEPLSPDEHSSAASTPTTPVHGSTLTPEASSGVPCTSPRNFKFQRMRQSSEEDTRESVFKTVNRSEGELSAASSPSAPSTPRELDDTECKPVLSAASSTNDLTTVEEEPMLEETPVNVEVELPQTTVNVDETSDVKTLSQSLTTRLTEISSSAHSSEVNSPSPCPSTTGSPTSAESVTSVCSGVVVMERSPGPAPGSPVAKLLHGPRNSSANPFYGSLKKRWLFQFLCGQNMANSRPPNGFKTNVSAPALVNSIEAPVISARRNCRRKLTQDCLPLKKRYLKKFQEMCAEVGGSRSDSILGFSADANKTAEYLPLRTSSAETIVLSNETLETAAHVPQLLPERQERATVLEQSVSANEGKSFTEGSEKQPESDSTISSSLPQASRELDSISVEKERPLSVSCEGSSANVLPPRRPSDPRLANFSVSPGAVSGTVVSVVQTTAANTVVPSAGVAQVQSSEVHSGTPGKKKVSLLEYRNRSRQRTSGDSPRPPPPVQSSSTTSVSQAASVIRSAASSLQSTAHVAQRLPSSPPSSNGPSVEPVSPDVEEKAPTGNARSQSSKIHTALAGGTNSVHDSEGRLSKELRKKKHMIAKKEEGMTKLKSFISGQLMKESKSPLLPTLGRSPSSNSSGSPSTAPPPPPPPETTGDAMEIEDDDNSLGASIYVNTPAAMPTPHPLPPPLQSALPGQYMAAPAHLQQPDFRMNVPQQHGLAHAQMLVSAGPIQVQQRIPPSSSTYLVTSPPRLSPVRFPPGYQGHQSQPTGFFPS